MNKYIVFMRFNRIPHGWDWAIARTLNNPKWWDSRMQIWTDTTKKSLRAQTDQDFEIWAVFDKQLCWTFPHIQALADFFQMRADNHPHVKVVMEDSNPTLSKVPIEELAKQEYAAYENVVLISLDCDDMLRKDAIAEYKKVPLKFGQSFVMENGYMWSKEDNRMASYFSKGAPGPFWAINFPYGVRKDKRMIFRYMIENGLDQEHFKMNHARDVYHFPDGMFLQVIHGANTTTGWKNKATIGHLGEDVRPVTRAAILKKFGL